MTSDEVSAIEPLAVGPVRVLIVDDARDIRMLLRLQLSRDPRFKVVGEAADGLEAIEIARVEQPDLVILDRQMPHLGGMEAMPEIRRVAPHASVVLYTANSDPWTYQAAIDAGALDVFEKGAGDAGFVDQLVTAVLDRVSASEATIEATVGPVSSAAARVWIPNTRAILDAAVAHPEVVGMTIPEDVVELFRSFLAQWEAVASGSDVFRWVARARPADVERAIEYWLAIDGMTDEQMGRLGVEWSPPEGAPFFDALAAGMLEALNRHQDTRRLAARLSAQVTAYRQRD